MAITDINGTTISPIGGWRVLSNSTARKTINLDAAPTAGRKISVTDTVGDASSNNITINANGSETIDGSASVVINLDNGRKVLKSTGSGWTVIETSTDLNAGGGGSVSVAGSNTEIQFNNSGSLGASSKLTFDGQTLTVEAVKEEIPTNLNRSNKTHDALQNFSKEYYWKIHKLDNDVPGSNAWKDVLQIQPYEVGTTTIIRANIWAAIKFEIEYFGNENGAGLFSYFAHGFIGYRDTGVTSTLSLTNGACPGFQVATSGGTATMQIKGGSHVNEVEGGLRIRVTCHVGAGSEGDCIWDLQDLSEGFGYP